MRSCSLKQPAFNYKRGYNSIGDARMIDKAEPASEGPSGIKSGVTSPEPNLAEFQFLSVVESVPDYAICLLDLSGTIRTSNLGVELICGYTAQEVIGRNFACLFPADEIEAGLPERCLRVAASDHRFETEGWRMRKDCSRFWAHVTITPLHGDNAQLCGFVQIIRDISLRTHLEKGDAFADGFNRFIAKLGHELRNHLAPLRYSAAVFQSISGLGHELSLCRDSIDRQVRLLTRMVDDLVDAANVAAGEILLNVEVVTAREIVTLAVERTRGKAGDRGLQFNLDIPADEIVLNGDRLRLTQALCNLLDNAVRFSPVGERIDVVVRADGGKVAIPVVDFRLGILPGAGDSIFDMFEQQGMSVPAQPGEPGFGLGLSVSRSLVRLHDGSVHAETAGPGRGTTVTVLLPTTRAACDQVSAAEHSIPPSSAPLRIVVVDDNRDSADSLGVLLQMKGHAARVAYCAVEALALARGFRPHLMLMDLSMPDVDRFGLLCQVRSSDELAETVCVAVSGQTGASDRERTRRAGFDDHLGKPVEMQALDAVLLRVASGRTRSDGERQ
ncbi:hybrid sensor histidine kinase/response regulator [Burkholderia multivorans]|nr:hybrid sensor histidine kinase/response regulator [Burkholderia multivorans]